MNITFWTTLDCNLKCAYCYNRASNNIRKEYMSSDVIQQGINLITKLPQFNPNDELAINFHGGEPLMNCDAIEAIMHYLEKIVARDKITYSLTTNGTLSSFRHREVLKKIDNISVSIDGNRQNHDKYRVYSNGKGSFDNVIEFAKYLNLESVIRVRATITPETVHNMYEIVIFLIEKGFKEIIPALDIFDQRWENVDEEIVFEQFGKIKRYLNEKERDDVFVGWVSKSLIAKKGDCTGGVTNFHILPNGDIYPCSMVVGEQEWLIGNTSKGLDSDRIQLIQELNKKVTTSCSNCGYYEYCESSRCKLVNRKITGDYFRASAITCVESRVTMEFMHVT